MTSWSGAENELMGAAQHVLSRTYGQPRKRTESQESVGNLRMRNRFLRINLSYFARCQAVKKFSSGRPCPRVDIISA